MRRNRIAALCAAALLLLQTGCQLARPDGAEPSAGGDRLVGIFITEEPLDLFDVEGYLQDNLNSLTAGGGMVAEGDMAQYQGRLYAEPVMKPYTDPETGEEREHESLAFPGVEGFAYFAPTMPGEDGTDSYVASMGDEGLSTSGLKLAYSDEKESLEMEVTLHVAAGGRQYRYVFNPVYQSADGGVYAVSGQGISMGGDMGEGGSFSHTLTESATVTEDGVSKTAETEIKASITVMNPPQRLVLLQMGEDSALLERTEYDPAALPPRITPRADTAYLILETHSLDSGGREKVTYAVYGREDSGMKSFHARADGVCVENYTTLIWGAA